MQRETWLAAGGDLFEELEQSELALERARLLFLQQAPDRAAVLRDAMLSAAHRRTALNLLPFTSLEERRRIFDALLEVASVGHADVGLARARILELPREWLLANIEAAAEPLLSGHEPGEEYRRLLELYTEIDDDLMRRLATRAASHPDPDVREAGEDFLERFGK